MKKAFFYFLISLIWVGVFWGVGEVCFRVFRGAPNPLEDITQKRTDYLLEPNVVKKNSSSKEGEFMYTARINNFGYRGRDFAMPKEKGHMRIFVIGDSFTYGVGAEENETIPYLIEKKLLDTGIKTEVVNAGIGHASPLTHYINLRDLHLKYQPDMILLMFDLTDLWDDWNREKHAVFDQKGEFLRFDPMFINGKRDWWITISYKSAFCRWIHNKIVRSFQKMRHLGWKKYIQVAKEGKRAKAEIINSKDVSAETLIEYDGLLMMRGRARKAIIDQHWRRTTKYLTKIKKLAEQHNIPMVMVMYPHGIYVGKDQWNEGRATWGFEQGKRYTDYYPFELMEAYAQKEGIPFVNTLGYFPKDTGTEYFFNWDGHMTPAGNHIVADSIVGSLEFRNVLFEKMKIVEGRE